LAKRYPGPENNVPLSIRDRLKLLFLPKAPYFSHMAAVELPMGEPELGILAHLVGRGGTAIDAGAHRGLYSYQFSRLCDQVLAFEPNPDFAFFARRALPRNVIVHQLALGSETGSGTLRVLISNGVAHHSGGSLIGPIEQGTTANYPVEIRTVDSFLVRDLKIIKIDVEGMELAVLEGARTTIARERPILIVELLAGRYADPIKTVERISHEFGYSGKIVADRRLVDAVQCLASGAPLASRNVVFVPAGREYAM